MFAAISPSEAADAPRLRAVALPQRTRGEGRLSFRRSDGGTRLDRLYQDGAARIRLPHAAGPQIEAILINTAGGLTGGDDMAWHIEAGGGASATIATPACEKIYRASASTARVEDRKS